MQESENYQKFLDFSNVISNDIPLESGEYLGPALVEKYEDNFTGLVVALMEFLKDVGFTEEESISCFKLAVNNSFYLAFNADFVQVQALA